MTKDKLPTINIKGKDYVQVKDRVRFFNDTYPQGSIRTNLESYDNGKVVIKAIVVPDTGNPTRYFSAYSQEDESQGMINKTSALENAETSAIGRALGFMGIGVVDSVASGDEVKKALVHSQDHGQNKWCKTHNSFWGATFPHCPKYQSGGEECFTFSNKSIMGKDEENSYPLLEE